MRKYIYELESKEGVGRWYGRSIQWTLKGAKRALAIEKRDADTGTKWRIVRFIREKKGK